MDPVTAIGLVSGILTFIGTTEMILKISWRICNSVEGSSEKTQLHLELSDKMKLISKRLIPINQSRLTEEDRALVTLAQECNKLANNIEKELQNLQLERRNSRTQSIRFALKTLMIEPKIRDMEKQLQRCRDQLHFHIAVLSRENLRALLATSKEDGAKMTRLEAYITQLQKTLKDMATTKVEYLNDEVISQLRNLLSVGQNALNEITQDRILRGIKGGFEDMFYRYQNIDSPFEDTFEWMWDIEGKSLKSSKFVRWLSSEDGIFHICGKLGSGKSTIMKNLCKHEETISKLKTWMRAKRRRRLIIAHFFFFALGSDPRQRSLMGLYRTLLHQILTASPNLMQELLPNQWAKACAQPRIHSAPEILDDDIKEAYARLSKSDGDALDRCCFCFFIDGLDEYQATTSVDHREMVRALTNLSNSASGSFKLCVSSRMENPFMDIFSEDRRLYLHELTSSDMEKYVRVNLKHVKADKKRENLASYITKKAEGVFLWVVLVVQAARRQLDNGAKFSALLREIESLPTEMNALFQRILDTLGTQDRRLVGATASILQFLSRIPEAKPLHLWLNLNDFYFFEDYISDLCFAEDAQFPLPETENFEKSRNRAKRRLRGACRGLVEVDKNNDLDFTHRSVGAFFNQDKVRAEFIDGSFHSLHALSQLKLASIKHYWWHSETYNGNNDTVIKTQPNILHDQSILVAALTELRRTRQLDVPPFGFFRALETIPELSKRTTMDLALSYKRTTFHTAYFHPTHGISELSNRHEICHTSQVRHMPQDESRWVRHWKEVGDDSSDDENPAVRWKDGVLWRDADEEVDEIREYSIAVICPMFNELVSGRLAYPIWRLTQIHDMPIESDKLSMLVYIAIGAGIEHGALRQGSIPNANKDNRLPEPSMVTSLIFLRHLLEQKILSPNLLTHLAFGAQHGSFRIAAGNQRLSIWQHFLCWWITVAAASGDFIQESDAGSDGVSLNSSCVSAEDFEPEECFIARGKQEPFYHPSEQYVTGFVLETFIRNGASLQLAINVKRRGKIPTDADDMWYGYTLHLLLDGRETLELDVAFNIKSRLITHDAYPYRVARDRIYHVLSDKAAQAVPSTPLSVRDWVDRSRLPNKDALFKLIDEKLKEEKLDGNPN